MSTIFDVSIRDLEVFFHVAAKRSFSGAADDLYITQSSVSKIISRLEKRLGVRLLIRDSHNVALAPAGEQLYGELKSILPHLEQLSTHLENFGAATHENISLTMPMAICNRLAIDFSAMHPAFQVSVKQMLDPYVAFSSLLNKSTALWIVPTAVVSEDYLSHLSAKPLHGDPIYVLLPKTNPLSSKSSLSIYEIKDEKFICHSEHFTLLLKTMGIKYGVNLNIIDKCTPHTSRTSCLIDVLNGKGLTIFYQSDFELLNMQDVVAIPIEEYQSCTVVAAYLKGRHLQPLELELLEYFIDNWPQL